MKASSPSFKNIKPRMNHAPSLTPRVFTSATMTIAAIATAFIPQGERFTTCPAYVARPTDSTAVSPGSITRNAIHPYMKATAGPRSEEHTSELQSRLHLVCRLLLEKKEKQTVY